ncbi:D-hexose-6-phosphate mutarotase [Propionibacteriaceae bacterium Y2011]|uniref:D-hexose-6-phosphate mutarotase n=1 Tax=Microlunatus sp. Y2014 TaxID=3418488 RepID=UPI003B484F93
MSTFTVELPPSARLVDGPAGPVIEVHHPAATGEVHLHGAHVTSWAPEPHGEVLWLSPESAYGPGEAIRGGIPICFPWFGPGPDDWQPMHGFARRVPWTLVGVREQAAGVTVRLRLTDTDLPDDLPGREHLTGGFTADLAVTFGAELDVTLETTNSGTDDLRISAALHTYFAVSDVRQVSLDGLAGAGYLDKAGGGDHRQDGPVTFTAETDRVYRSTADVTLVDGPRRVVISKSGSPHTVVWNPWVAKSARLPDFPDAGWPQMACVEAAIVPGDEVTLGPGASHVLGQHIRVS